MKRTLSFNIAASYKEDNITFAITRQVFELVCSMSPIDEKPLEVLKIFVDKAKECGITWSFDKHSSYMQKLDVEQYTILFITSSLPHNSVVFCTQEELNEQAQLMVSDGQNLRKLPK